VIALLQILATSVAVSDYCILIRKLQIKKVNFFGLLFYKYKVKSLLFIYYVENFVIYIKPK